MQFKIYGFSFIRDLNWPEEDFASRLQTRMRNLTSDMISKCASCTYQCFDNFMQKSKKSVDYVLPVEVCVMINVIFSSKIRAARLEMDSVNDFRFRNHSNLNETLDTMLVDMSTSTREKLLSILAAALQRLARYDEGNPIGALLTMAGALRKADTMTPRPNVILNRVKNLVSENHAPPGSSTQTPFSSQSQRALPGGQQNAQNTSEHLGQTYMRFLCNSSEQLQQVIVDEEWVNKLFETWYDGQIKMINDWLTERIQQSLSLYQVTCLSFIIKKIYSEFELHGIDEQLLNSKIYGSIQGRIQLEETNAALNDRTQNRILHQNGALPNYLGTSASQAVNSVGRCVEGAGQKVFAMFNK